jgi:hypothetical protein
MTHTIHAMFADGTNIGTYWSHMEVNNNTILHQFIQYLQRHFETHHDHFDFKVT